MPDTLQRRTVVMAGLASVVAPIAAQSYPSRPIKFVVGYVAGGAPDIFARTLGTQLAKVLGQNIVVENRLGAGGTIGAAQVSGAIPDGYTLLVAESAQIELAPLLFKKLSYDPVQDFTHIARLSVSPGLGIVVSSKNQQLRTMEDLIREARANPGKLNYGSSGIGSTHHVVMEGLKYWLGLDIVHVPYKGSSESVPAVMAGDVQVTLSALQSVMEDVRGGKLRLLATSGSRRFRGTPDTPIMGEFIKNYEPIVSQFSMLGPPRMPPDVIARLSSALKEVLAQPETVARIYSLNYEPMWSNPEDYKLEVQENLKKYARAMRIAGIQPS